LIAVAQVPHLSFPLTLAPDGDLAVVEQDSAADVAQQVAALVRTPVGWSDELPGMGLTGQAFYEGGADPVEIEEQLREHVPGFEGAVEERPDAIDEALSVVSVRISPNA
jgi:hypothetical protein